LQKFINFHAKFLCFVNNNCAKLLGQIWKTSKTVKLQFNKNSGTVIAVAITSQPQRAGFPLTLELGETKLPKKSWVKISQIRTLSVKRLRKKLGVARTEELDLAVEGINEIIGG